MLWHPYIRDFIFSFDNTVPFDRLHCSTPFSLLVIIALPNNKKKMKTKNWHRDSEVDNLVPVLGHNSLV